MTGFVRRFDGGIDGLFDVTERGLLISLTGQLIDILEAAPTSPDDPALTRLFPDAYRDDADASAEFRRLVGGDIARGKVDDARCVAASLGSGDDECVPLDDAAVQAWLRTLTDLRLTIATRLGITEDDEEGDEDAAERPLHRLYLWCGYVQESLLAAMET